MTSSLDIRINRYLRRWKAANPHPGLPEVRTPEMDALEADIAQQFQADYAAERLLRPEPIR